MRKLNILLIGLLTLTLVSCNSNSTTEEINADEPSYEHEFSTAVEFNDFIVDIVDVVINKENDLIQCDTTTTGEIMEKMRQEYVDLVSASIDKLEKTKPYYAGEKYLSTSIDYLKTRFETANKTWKSIVDILGEKQIYELSDEEYSSIDDLMVAANEKEQKDLVIAQAQQEVFAAANNFTIEDSEE